MRVVRCKRGRRAVLINPHIRRKDSPMSNSEKQRIYNELHREEVQKNLRSIFGQVERDRVKDEVAKQLAQAEAELREQELYDSRYSSSPRPTMRYKSVNVTNKEMKNFRRITADARRLGYKVPRLDNKEGPLFVQKIDLPENVMTEALTIQVPYSDKAGNAYVTLLDTNASDRDNEKALAHEIAHDHMFETKEKPHTEKKADTIAARILHTSVHDIQDTTKCRMINGVAEKEVLK